MNDILKPVGVYTVVCIDKDGNKRWNDTIENLITTVGKNLTLDETLAGSGYTASFYMGLTSATPTPNVADTMASHGGWTENQAYSEGARQTCAFSAASGGSKSLSSALSFSIDEASQTVGGCFINTVATKGGTTGTLLSVGAFTGGNKAVGVGDTLQVSYSLSL